MMSWNLSNDVMVLRYIVIEMSNVDMRLSTEVMVMTLKWKWYHGICQMMSWNLPNNVMELVKWCHGISQTSNPTSLGLALESVRSDIVMDAKFGFVSKKYPNPEIFTRIVKDFGNLKSNQSGSSSRKCELEIWIRLEKFPNPEILVKFGRDLRFWIELA